MRLDLADRLRCPRAHAPSPLVVVARQVDDRELVAGFAGCPVCDLEARIVDRVVRFPRDERQVAGESRLSTTFLTTDNGVAEGSTQRATDVASGHDDFTRLAALLGLDEPGGTVLLTGSYARFAARLATELELAVVIVGPPTLDTSHGMPAVSLVELAEPAIPFSDHTFRAAALDASGTPEHVRALMTDAVRTVAIGGRVLAMEALPLPDDVKELARDEREWVGQRERAAMRVTLGRARAE